MPRLSVVMADRSVRIAAAVFALTSAGAVVSLQRALHIEEIDVTPTVQRLDEVPAMFDSKGMKADIRGAVQVDPFMPSRSAPAKKYLLPHEQPPEAPTSRPARTLPVATGLVQGKDSASSYGFFAPRPGAPPVKVMVGGRIGDYTLVAVKVFALYDRLYYRAILVSSAGERLELTLK